MKKENKIPKRAETEITLTKFFTAEQRAKFMSRIRVIVENKASAFIITVEP